MPTDNHPALDPSQNPLLNVDEQMRSMFGGNLDADRLGSELSGDDSHELPVVDLPEKPELPAVALPANPPPRAKAPVPSPGHVQAVDTEDLSPEEQAAVQMGKSNASTLGYPKGQFDVKVGQGAPSAGPGPDVKEPTDDPGRSDLMRKALTADRVSVSHSGPSSLQEAEDTLDEAGRYADTHVDPFPKRAPDPHAGLREQLLQRGTNRLHDLDAAPVAPDQAPITPHEVPDVDWAAKYRSAQNETDKLRFLNMMRLAGQSTLRHSRPDDALTRAFDADSNRPLERLQSEQALDKLARAQMAEKESSDPSSKTNRRAQDALLAALPPTVVGKIGLERIRAWTKPQIDSFLGIQKQRDAEAEGASKDLSGLLQQDENSQDKAYSSQVQGYNAEQGAKAKTRQEVLDYAKSKDQIALGLKKAEMGVGGKTTADDWKAIQKATESTKDFAAAKNAFDQLDGLTGGAIYSPSIDISKADLSHIPNEADKMAEALRPGMMGLLDSDEKKQQFKNAVTAAMVNLRHPIAGANISGNELAEWNDLFGRDALKDPAKTVIALRMVKERLQRDIQSRQAGYLAQVKSRHPEMLDAAKKEGMVTASDLTPPKPKPIVNQQTGEVAVRRPDGKFDIYSKEEARAAGLIE